MYHSTIEKRFVRAGSFGTTYLEAGTDHDNTVVLLHDGGFGGNSDVAWSGVIPLLASDYHVVAPDLLGFGGTDKAVFLDRSPYAGRIAHIADFVSVLGITDAGFIGSSFGGSVILHALTEQPDPWRIKWAMSISGTGGPYRLPSGIQALADYDDPSLDAARRLSELIVSDSFDVSDHAVARYHASLLPGHWEAMNAPKLHNPALPRPEHDTSFLNRLSRVDRPVRFVEGRNDGLLESEWATTLANLSHHFEAKLYDSGHEPNIEMPEIIADDIKDCGKRWF